MKAQLGIKGELRQALSQSMQRSLEILQLPSFELGELILEEIEKNPLLELESHPFSRSKEEFKFPDQETLPSLYDHLTAQIREAFSGNEFDQAMQLLEHLDEKGFLTVDAPEPILKTMQSFDPPGIFARNLREAFLLQLKKGTMPYRIIEESYEDLLAGRLKKLEKKFGAEFQISLKKIARLATRPAACFEHTVVRHVYPDLKMVKVDKKWSLEPIEDALPKFRIKTEYNDIQKLPKEEKETLKGFATSAKWLQRSIERRRDMLLSMGKYLVQKQASFLSDEGPLKPICPNELAIQFGVHESTISRALSDKYLEGPKGVIQLRALVSSHGNESAKDLLQRLISQENKKEPLTDQQIVESLKKAGHKIARRTISKYRDQLGILSAATRKNRV